MRHGLMRVGWTCAFPVACSARSRSVRRTRRSGHRARSLAEQVIDLGECDTPERGERNRLHVAGYILRRGSNPHREKDRCGALWP